MIRGSWLGRAAAFFDHEVVDSKVLVTRVDEDHEAQSGDRTRSTEWLGEVQSGGTKYNSVASSIEVGVFPEETVEMKPHWYS